MSRWTAPSDLDYYDAHRTDGLERSCHECHEPVMVRRNEEYQVHIFCPTCLDAIRQRHLARRQQMHGDAA